MEHHRASLPGSQERASSETRVQERAREYGAFEEDERRRLESYSHHLTERERNERFPIG